MTPKRLLLLAYGSRGDVQPFLPLAAGLLRAGYAVRLMAPQMKRNPAVLEYGLEGAEIIELEGDIDALAEGLVQRAGLNPLRTLTVMSQFIFPLARRVYKAIQEGSRDVDGIVHSFLFTDGGRQLGQALGVPDFSVQFFPVLAPTGDFPGMTFPRKGQTRRFAPTHGSAQVDGGWLARRYNLLTHQFNTAAFRYGGRLMYALLRRGDPGLPPLAGWPFDGPVEQRTPLLFAFSPQVVQRAPEWPANVQVTGYFTPPEAPWQPPDELERFLEAGDPPVYIGFGSMLPQRSEHIRQACLEALQMTGLRAVLALPNVGTEDGRAGLGPAPTASANTETTITVGHTPHPWLFPRLAAVVHHGGAGTAGAAFRAGVPQVVVPFFGDQTFWAERAAGLGAAPPPFSLRKLTARRLAEALEMAVHNPAMRIAAQALGERIRQEDGVARAVEFISRAVG